MENLQMDGVLQELEEFVNNSSRVPLTGKILIDGDMILEYIERIKALLPEEMRQAREVLNQSDKLLANVESQGQRILAEAKEQASQLVSETEVYQLAVNRAEELQNNAEMAAQELRKESIVYSDDVLQQLEINLEKIIFSVKKNRDELKNFTAGK